MHEEKSTYGMKDIPMLGDMHQQMLAHLVKGIRWFPPLPPFFTGYEGGELWDWDQYFEAIVLLYAGYPSDFIRNSIKIFLGRQKADGLIERAVPPGGGEPNIKHRTHLKPFLAQQLLLCLNADGSLEWLRSEGGYGKVKKYLDYWLVKMDLRGAGLSVWTEAGHTGMDNHYERAGTWDGEHSFCEGVDLNSYLVRECRAMALVSKELGYAEDAIHYETAAQQRHEAIQRYLWNEEEQIYYDFHAARKKAIRIKYVGAFLPLWSGDATAEQAAQLVKKHLLNEKEFWRPYPIPAMAATEPGYVEGFPEGHPTGCCSWRAHTWVPTNYMVFQGLRAYGFSDTAHELADRTWKMFLRGRFSEYYTSENGIGTGRKPFWGWTCLALFFHREMDLGIDPTSLASGIDTFKLMRRQLLNGGTK